jgi:hypothetical protein
MKLAALILALGLSQAAFGTTLFVTLDSTTLSGTPGSTVTFSGSLTNTTNVEQFLVSADFSGLGPGFTVDTAPFLNNSPLSLLANQTTASFDMFTVMIPIGANPGPFVGTFTILGGPNDGDQTILNTGTEVTVNVITDTPEPASAMLSLVGLAAIGIAGLRTRRPR